MADAGDPTSLVTWLIHHPREVFWLAPLVFAGVVWLNKRLTRPLAGPAAPSRKADVLEGLRVALAAAQNAKSQATAGAAPGAPRRPTPSPPRAPVAAPAAGVAAQAPRRVAAAPLAARPPLLDAFRDPAGARAAVILAEILAKPVGLR